MPGCTHKNMAYLASKNKMPDQSVVKGDTDQKSREVPDTGKVMIAVPDITTFSQKPVDHTNALEPKPELLKLTFYQKHKKLILWVGSIITIVVVVLVAVLPAKFLGPGKLLLQIAYKF